MNRIKWIITFLQRKGGTGKSTAALNLAHVLAILGYRVLLIDIDDQQNATSSISQHIRADLTVADLRRIDPKALDPLMGEETELWLERLGWDYRPTQAFLRGYIKRHMLPGFAILEGSRAQGYLYIVLEGERCIVGNVYVARERWGDGLESRLAVAAAEALKATPGVRRIEAQLLIFSGADIADDLDATGFEVFQRHFLSLELGSWDGSRQAPAGLELCRWDDSMIDEVSRVVFEGYRGGIDAYFSSSFGSADRCREFVFNLVRRAGCGRFLPAMSTIGFGPEGDILGVVIATQLSSSVGHLPQISVAPAVQGRGFGAFLVAESLRRFRKAGYRSVSLTVTEENRKAYDWYLRIGFTDILPFDAYLWLRPRGSEEGIPRPI